MSELREKTDFKKDLVTYGPIGERRLMEILSARGRRYEDISDIEEFRIFDIDIIQYNDDVCTWKMVLDAYYHGKYASDVNAVAYEVKTDTYGVKSRNIVYEVISNSNSGCLARTKADYLFYVFLNKENEIIEEFLIDIKKLRWWIMENFDKVNNCDYLKSKSMRRGKDNTGIFLINIDYLVANKPDMAKKLK